MTVKTDILAKVVEYHLGSDGRQSLTHSNDGRDVLPDSKFGTFEANPEQPDKIVIYSAFPSSNQVIFDVSLVTTMDYYA